MSELTFIFSSMNGGKSTQLLQKAHSLEEAGYTVKLFKPRLDTRDNDKIKSRIGIEKDAMYMDQIGNFFDLENEKPDFILIDEAQFLSKEEVDYLAFTVTDMLDINVICYGLKLSWQGELFEGSKRLIEVADNVIQMDNLCKYEKGKKAFFHIKHTSGEEAVEVGDMDIYESVSRKTWALYCLQ